MRRTHTHTPTNVKSAPAQANTPGFIRRVEIHQRTENNTTFARLRYRCAGGEHSTTRIRCMKHNSFFMLLSELRNNGRPETRLGVKATNSKAKARGVEAKAKAKALTSKAKAKVKDLASKAKAKDLTAKAKDLAPHPPIRSRPRYSQYITSHSLEPHYLKVLMMMQVCVVKKKKTVKG